jgi:small-conductance mechanosensitive channel
MTPDLLALVSLALLVVAAAAVHRYLSRLGRRLAHRRPAAGSGGVEPLRRVHLALLVLKLGLWGGVAFVLSERLPELRMSREAALDLVSRSLTAPLFSVDGRGYSAVNLVALPALLVGLWIGVSVAVGVFKRQLARVTGGARGVHESVAILLRLLLAFLGAVVIFQAWGLDVSSLTFVASVLGVGIGFGLQNIANNFVSGILIGLERPVQPGDFVRVGEFSGTVKRVGARSTEIETLDRVSILVPNARFLESEVINWSHGDPTSRVHVPVGVAYGTSPAVVRSALLEAARRHPQVLADPRPEVHFLAFGESALEFELLVWTRDPRRQFLLKSDLHFRIEESLRRSGISVPFPQRDLHVRSPELLEAVRAWTRRTFSDEERAAAQLVDRADREPPPALHLGGDDGALLSDAFLASLVERMRGADGLELADRRHLLRTHRRCFVGQQAVDWLVRHEGLTRAEAVSAGQRLLERGVLHHVLDEHDFRDGNFYYRFRADEEALAGSPAPGRMAANGTAPVDAMMEEPA